MANTSKLTTLEHLKQLAVLVKQYDDALGGRIDGVVDQVNDLVTAGGEPNKLEGIKVNGVALAIAEKMVDILIATGTENGTIKVNGTDVAVKGLADLAYKAQVSEADLDTALTAVIAAKATQADLEAMGVRVTTLEGDVKTLKEAGYQNESQVAAAISAAISASGHAHFEKANSVPTASTAKENVLYLVMNSKTNHYDIYALVSGEVVLIDDTTVDLSAYSNTEQMTAAIQAAINGLNIGDYAKIADLNSAIGRISVVEGKFASYYTKDEIDGMIATHAEAEIMLNSVFNE